MRALLGTVLVLALLLVGADIGGRLFAQSQASKALAENLPAAGDPKVSIHGFSFLLQAVKGDYSEITLTSSNVTLGPLTGVSAEVDLRDVDFPLSDAISGDISNLIARRADFRAVIPADSLGNALDQPNLTIAPTADGMVQLGTTISIGGTTIPVMIAATASISSESLVFAVKLISAAGITLPAKLAETLQAKLTTKLSLKDLPFPIDHASVSAEDGALVVTGSGANVSAEQLGFAGSHDASGAAPTRSTSAPQTSTPTTR